MGPELGLRSRPLVIVMVRLGLSSRGSARAREPREISRGERAKPELY